MLYLGTPSGGFTDNQASHAGVVGDDSWGVNFLDVDHDGWEDLFITTMLGAAGEFLFANNGDGTFTTWPDVPESLPATAAAAPSQITIETATWTSRWSTTRTAWNGRDLRYSGFVGRVAYDGAEPRCSLQLLRNETGE